MNERQRRHDAATAKAVARGLNILPVRGAVLARRYMEYKRVPEAVIDRTLSDVRMRRRLSAEQSVSEAIVPTGSET